MSAPNAGGKWKPLFRLIESVYGLDIRSLALFRIAMGLMLLVNLWLCTSDLSVFYTDSGLLPRYYALKDHIDPWNLSLFFIHGSWAFQALLFLLSAVFAVALLVGYRTRLATFVSWLLLISLQVRNPLILQSGDNLFRLLLFWGLFLPLGACCSIDNWRHPASQPVRKTVLSGGSIALLLQTVFLYCFTAAWKTGIEWRSEFSATYYALSLDQFTTPLGYILLPHPVLLKCLTASVYYLESWGWLLLLCPVLSGPVRTLGVFLFILMHMGMGSCLYLGTFPWFDATGLVALLPGWFWDKLLFRLMPGLSQTWQNGLKTAWSFLQPICSTVRQGYSVLSAAWQQSRVVLFHGTAVFLILYVFFWNFGDLHPRYAIPGKYKWLGPLLMLSQRWDMFSPFPLKEDGWYVIPGQLMNGQEVNVLHPGKPISWGKPMRLAESYPNEHWRKYMMNLYLPSTKEETILNYGRYICRSWNQTHQADFPHQLRTFEIYFMSEPSLPNYQIPLAQKRMIWQHRCFDSTPPKPSSK